MSRRSKRRARVHLEGEASDVLLHQMHTWYRRAQIDYLQQYMALYAAFNSWYRALTGISNDRQALNTLRQGVPIWEEYQQGLALRELMGVMRELVECTQREPLSTATPHWDGEVQHVYDWPSLIEYWYRVRCLVMHGGYIKIPYVLLAYQSLNIFMSKLIEGNATNTVYNSSKTSYN